MAVYTSEELRAVQLIELEALKEVVRVCDKLSIECFLVGGSCLGAMRHGGFIPWDDDIDVGMRREDYDRFLKEAPSILNNRFFLQTPYTDKNSAYSYAKVRVNGTMFVEYCNRKNKMHQGIYCDVFPFDNVPDDDTKNKKQFVRFTRLNYIFFYRQTPDVSCPPNSIRDHFKSIVRKVMHYSLVLFTNKERLYRSLLSTATEYNGKEQSSVACLHFPKWKGDEILLSDLYPLKSVQFEGITVKVPRNAEKYLTTHYGDWRTLPPESQQVGHKPYRVEISS
ncbi:MAG: LicD family protein [Bacteroidales bacterium]|nr:LicD family protein [Bacteroidales bacterium]